MQRANERQEVTKPLSEPSSYTSPQAPHEPEVNIDPSDNDSSAPENRRRTGEGAVRGGEAHRFKPGQSGNPRGRPKTGALTRAFRALLEQPIPGDRQKRTYAQAIAERLAELAVKGYLPAVRELGDRAEGRTVPCVQLTDLVDETPNTPRADSNVKTGTEELQGRKTTKTIEDD